MYIDGVLVDKENISGDFGNWSSYFDLSIGNEFSTGSSTLAREA